MKSRIPHIRTIQRIVRENTPQDPSAPWQLAEASGGDAALVLPVLAAMIEVSEGRLKALSTAKAEWIVKLRRVADDLPLWAIYELTIKYMLRRERHNPTDDLDAFLAFAPWRSKEHNKRYCGLGAILPVRYMLARGPDGVISVCEDDGESVPVFEDIRAERNGGSA